MKQNRLNKSIVFRGLAHMLVGLALAVIIYLFPRNWTLFLIGLATFLVLTFDVLRLRFRPLRNWMQSTLHSLMRNYESKRLLGASFLLAAALVTAVLFSKEIAVLAMSFMAVGDALAGIFGRRFGRIKFLGKSLEGTLAGLAGCIIAGFVWRVLGLEATIPVVLAGAVSAMIFEILPLPVDDNVTTPIGAALVMFLVSLISH